MMILGNALAQCWGNDDHAVYNTHASKTVLRALVWALKCFMTSWHRLMSNWCSNRFLTDNRRCCGGKTVECNTCSSSTRPYLLLEGQQVFFQSTSKFWCLWMLVEKAIFSVLLIVWAMLYLLLSEHILVWLGIPQWSQLQKFFILSSHLFSFFHSVHGANYCSLFLSQQF